jgi:hypothetical protein
LEKLIEKYTLTLNRRKGRYILTIGGDVVEQNICEFLHTFSFLAGKDLEEYLLSTDSQYDTIRIPLSGCGKVITLDLAEFIAFREVYQQEMFRIKLEDLLLRQGIKLS